MLARENVIIYLKVKYCECKQASYGKRAARWYGSCLLTKRSWEWIPWIAFYRLTEMFSVVQRLIGPSQKCNYTDFPWKYRLGEAKKNFRSFSRAEHYMVGVFLYPDKSSATTWIWTYYLLLWCDLLPRPFWLRYFLASPPFMFHLLCSERFDILC